MKEFLKRAWFIVGIPALLLGLVYGAASIDKPWAWYSLGVAIVVSILLAGVPNAIDAANILRNNARTLKRIHDLEEENKQLKTATQELESAETQQYKLGVAEGLRRARGARLSAAVKEPPELVNKSVDQGIVYLYAKPVDDSKIEAGTRFRLETTGSKELKGIVEVDSVVESTGMINLVCIETTVPEYWEHLAQQRADPSPPPAVSLARYELSEGS